MLFGGILASTLFLRDKLHDGWVEGEDGPSKMGEDDIDEPSKVEERSQVHVCDVHLLY